jgi:hypothetical protein
MAFWRALVSEVEGLVEETDDEKSQKQNIPLQRGHPSQCGRNVQKVLLKCQLSCLLLSFYEDGC